MKPNNKDESIETFKVKNDMEVLKSKIKNIVEINEIKELINKEIEKENILNNTKWEEFNKNINVLLDFKKKGIKDFSTMNDRINKQDVRLDKMDLILLDKNKNIDTKQVNSTVENMKKK